MWFDVLIVEIFVILSLLYPQCAPPSNTLPAHHILTDMYSVQERSCNLYWYINLINKGEASQLPRSTSQQ